MTSLRPAKEILGVEYAHLDPSISDLSIYMILWMGDGQYPRCPGLRVSSSLSLQQAPSARIQQRLVIYSKLYIERLQITAVWCPLQGYNEERADSVSARGYCTRPLASLYVHIW